MKNKFEDFASFFTVLSNPTRLRILDELINNCTGSNSKNGCCVCEINHKIDLPQPYISKHLKVLRDAGFLNFKKEGNKIYYTFSKDGLNVFKHISRFLNKLHIKCC